MWKSTENGTSSLTRIDNVQKHHFGTYCRVAVSRQPGFVIWICGLWPEFHKILGGGGAAQTLTFGRPQDEVVAVIQVWRPEKTIKMLMDFKGWVCVNMTFWIYGSSRHKESLFFFTALFHGRSLHTHGKDKEQGRRLREAPLVGQEVVLPSANLPRVDRHEIHLHSRPLSYLRQKLSAAGWGAGDSPDSPSNAEWLGAADGRVKVKAIWHIRWGRRPAHGLHLTQM